MSSEKWKDVAADRPQNPVSKAAREAVMQGRHGAPQAGMQRGGVTSPHVCISLADDRHHVLGPPAKVDLQPIIRNPRACLAVGETVILLTPPLHPH